MYEHDIKKYTKYPTLIPSIEIKKTEIRDLTPVAKVLFLVGIILSVSSSLFILLLNPDGEISLTLLIVSLLLTAPFVVKLVYNVLYEANWIKLRIDSELPYFLSSLAFLIKSGKSLLDSIKIIVRENVFKYISQSLRGVEYATSGLEVENIAFKCKSPFLARVIREVTVDPNRIDRLIDEALKKYSSYCVDHLKTLNYAYKTVFCIVVLSSLVPLSMIFYHVIVYEDLSESYVISWFRCSIIYLLLIYIGLLLILSAIILLKKPTYYPIIVFDRFKPKSDKLGIAVLISLSILMLMLSTLYPPCIILAVAVTLYVVYMNYSTARIIPKINDMLNSYAYLCRELHHEFVLQSLMAKGYDQYIHSQLRKALEGLKENGVMDVDDPNLKPFFKVLSHAGEKYRSAVDEYVVNINAVFNVHKYVNDVFSSSNPKPYHDFTILYLIFMPLILASGYILSWISIPIVILLKVVSFGFNFTFDMDSTDNLNIWENIGPIDAFLSLPPFSQSLFDILSMIVLAIVLMISVLLTISRHDYNPVDIIKYSAVTVFFNIFIQVLSCYLATLL